MMILVPKAYRLRYASPTNNAIKPIALRAKCLSDLAPFLTMFRMAYLTNLVLSSSGVGGVSTFTVGSEMGLSMDISLILAIDVVDLLIFN
jgi:hypothetical protein